MLTLRCTIETPRKTLLTIQGNQMKLIKDLGMRFTPGGSKRKFRYGLYECPYCGENVEAVTSNVKRSKSGRCTKCKFITNDKKNSPQYNRWSSMISRCYNPKAPNYKDYGARCIKVYLLWKNSFKAYSKYINTLPNAGLHGLTIDRIDNNLGYYPGNLRWATPTVQGHNTRISKRNTSGTKGVQFHKASGKWRASITINKETTCLGSYSEKDDAITARKDAEERFTL